MLVPLSLKYAAHLTGVCLCAALVATSAAAVWNTDFFFEGLLWLAFGIVLLRWLPAWVIKADIVRLELRNNLVARTQEPFGPTFKPHGPGGLWS